MILRMRPAVYQNDPADEQLELREKYGLDGVETILAVKVYLTICEKCRYEPKCVYIDASWGSHWVTAIYRDDMQSLMEVSFTEDFLKLLNHFGDEVLEVLLEVYGTTKGMSSAVIPMFIEAMETGAELSVLSTVTKAVLQQRKTSL